MRRPLLFVLAMLCALYSFSQSKTVTGTVTDSRDGQPLAGVTVTVKGTSNSTTSQPDGSFSISAPANATTLVFSSVGYQALEAPIGTGVVNVQLNIGQNTLSEVVITGYAVQNKRQVAGSISRIKADEIKLQPIGSFDKALQGKIPGLLSQSMSGQPGAPATVTIRGKGSINGSNTPLFIMDGVQINSADFATINPSDIETYTVLKDASSTAIYGSRGANGVIVITTRRGSAGKTKINYDFQYGYSELPKNRLALMDSKEKLDYELNYNRRGRGKNPFRWRPSQIDSLGRIDNNLDEILFRKGKTQQHTLSASGGNDKTRFFLSGSIFDQEGVVLATGLKRYTGRANVENSFGNFKVGLNATLGYSKFTNSRENDTYVGSPLNAINWFNPYVTLYDAEGEYQDDFLQGQPNPLRELLENKSVKDQVKGVGSAFIEFNVPWVKGLKARTLWGVDYADNDESNYLDRTTNAGQQANGANGQLQRKSEKNFRYTATTSLSYQREFGEHSLNAALYNEVIQQKTRVFGFTGYGIVGPFKNESGITPGTPTNGYIPDVEGDGETNGLLSYFVDATYGYRNRYFLSAGARRDGSSRFGADRKYANFGQVGFSWIVSDENFLQSTQGWLSELKYKISYGTVGNQFGIANFEARELLGPVSYNGVGGLTLNNLYKPDLRWEKKQMFNTGIEFTLFRGKVGGTFEFYSNVTKDLFLDRQLSRTSGYASINTNLGRLRNQGIEASINVDIVRSRYFSLTLSANHTYNKNKILDQAGQDENVTGLFINKVGERANSIYVVRYAGVDPANGNALYYQKADNKTTSTYDPDDNVIVGTIDPPHFGGFSTNVNYKGIELDVLFSYAFGNMVFNNDRTNVENPTYWFSRLADNVLREWRNPGDITDIPSSFSPYQVSTTRYVEKGDYLRLRNVTLSYNLPKTLLEKVKINNARVFVQGQNLHVWHSFQGYDPEVTTGNLLGAQYPQLKTIMFGLSVGL